MKRFIISVDLGGTNLRLALFDLRYKFKGKISLDTSRFMTPEALIGVVADSIEKMIADCRLDRDDILGVGIGVPGPVDPGKGKVHFLPNISGWKNVNLKKILESKSGMPVFLDNDAKLMSLAELRLGAASGFKNAVCLTLGTGVGGSVIINGSIYRGSTFAAGEIGHIPISVVGPKCNCAGIGCLEAYIGNKAILNRAKKIFSRAVTLEELSGLAARGNRKALKLWAEVGVYLATALTGIVNLLNPDAIVIGGGVAGAGRALFGVVRREILKRAMSVQAAHVRIYPAKLGSDAGLIGAAILVKDNS